MLSPLSTHKILSSSLLKKQKNKYYTMTSEGESLTNKPNPTNSLEGSNCSEPLGRTLAHLRTGCDVFTLLLSHGCQGVKGILLTGIEKSRATCSSHQRKTTYWHYLFVKEELQFSYLTWVTTKAMLPLRIIPEEMHSNTLRSASPGLCGVDALLIAFSTNSSIA